jgi:hypothetical protein
LDESHIKKYKLTIQPQKHEDTKRDMNCYIGNISISSGKNKKDESAILTFYYQWASLVSCNLP